MKSLVAPSVKNLTTVQWAWKIPWRRNQQPSPVFLPGESHGRGSLVGYSPRGRKESDTTEQLHFHFHFHEDLQDLLELTPKKDILFITGDQNAKAGSQETSGVTGKFGLGVQNEVGQRLTVLPRKRTGHSEHPLPTTQDSTRGHHQMVNTEIRLITFFAAEGGEALYSQQ